MDAKEIIARRVASELHDRTLVNLGIGLPTLVADYVPPASALSSRARTASSASAPGRRRAWRTPT